MVKKEMKGRKNIIELIGKGFELWWKNPAIILPFLFYTLIIVVAGLILFLLMGLVIFGSSFGGQAIGTSSGFSALQGLAVGESNDTTMEKLVENLSVSPGMLALVIVFVIVFVLVLMFARAFFSSGAIAMAKEVTQGKKTSLATMNRSGKKFFWRYFLVELIIGLGVVIWLLIFSLPAILTKNITLAIIPLISLILLFFLYLLFYLAEYVLVLNDLNPFEALKESFNIVKKNYWATLGLFVLFSLMSLVISFIPLSSFLNFFIQLLVLTPAMTIAFTLFTLERQ
ncbi:MAG: hypothetical protein ACPLXC_02235 [Candidatus Pacearchaeota archaeon]